MGTHLNTDECSVARVDAKGQEMNAIGSPRSSVEGNAPDDAKHADWNNRSTRPRNSSREAKPQFHSLNHSHTFKIPIVHRSVPFRLTSSSDSLPISNDESLSECVLTLPRMASTPNLSIFVLVGGDSSLLISALRFMPTKIGNNRDACSVRPFSMFVRCECVCWTNNSTNRSQRIHDRIISPECPIIVVSAKRERDEGEREKRRNFGQMTTNIDHS